MDWNDTYTPQQMIEELTTQNARLGIINQIAKSINVQMDYETIIDQMADPLRKVIDYDLLSFCLIEHNHLVIKSGVPKQQEILGVGTELPKYNSAPWQAVKKRECFLRQDIPGDDYSYAEDSSLSKIGIKSAIMAPMFNRGQVIGTLNFGAKSTHAYSEGDFVFVQQLADQLAVAIQNMHLYAEVVKSKTDWEVTFKAVPDNIFLIDASHKILRVNNAFNDFTPYQLLHRNCHEIFPFCNFSCHECPIQETFANSTSAFREVHAHDKIYNIYTYPVQTDRDQIDKLVLYIQDVTEKKQMETQLFHSLKLAEIGEMAAGIAHELNSPLTAVVGNSGLLLRKMSSANREYQLMKDIHNCGKRCKDIIQNLLTFARQNNYAFSSIDVNKIVENSLSLIGYQIEKNNVCLVTELQQDLPLITGNEQELEQVVINFLLNARDVLDKCRIDQYRENEQKSSNFTSAQQGQISIFTNKLDADILNGEERQAVEIVVSDNGPGISPDIQDKIFNPFFTTKPAGEGTGLGLSVSLGIAKSHGGTIEIDSKPGQGTAFHLILPVQN